MPFNEVNLSLSKMLKERFSPAVRMKGDVLWRRSKVTLVHAKGDVATFTVRGTQKYQVTISTQPAGTFHLDCSCPHFNKGNACKHIWASVLESNEQKLFKTPLHIVQSHTSVDYDQEIPDDEDEFYGDREGLDFKSLDHLPLANHAGNRTWRDLIRRAQDTRIESRKSPVHDHRTGPAKDLIFAIDLPASLREQEIQLKFLTRDHLKNGDFGIMKQAELSQDDLALFPDPKDRELLQAALGRTNLNASSSYYSMSRGVSSVGVPDDYAETLLAQISKAKKLYLQIYESYSTSRNFRLVPDEYHYIDGRWNLVLMLTQHDDAYYLTAKFKSGERTQPLHSCKGYVGRFVIFEDFMAASDLDWTHPWLDQFMDTPAVEIPTTEIDGFLQAFMGQTYTPEIELPKGITFTEVTDVPPKPVLIFSTSKGHSLVEARLAFRYNEHMVMADEPAPHLYDATRRQRLLRDRQAELDVEAKFRSLAPIDGSAFSYEQFDAAAETALGWGWEVIADQVRLQSATNFEIAVSSGIDWFDLEVEFDFQGTKIGIAQLLPELKAGKRFVTLGDGTLGMMPAEWLQRFGPLAELGKNSGKGLRLNKIQALFLSAHLQGNEKFRADRKFTSLKDIVAQLTGAVAVKPHKSFTGELRGYQQEGLAWLKVIADNGIGGILADDMGLGKTIQMLALLAERKPKQADEPTLIVAPKSLVINWMQEAARFTPQLKVMAMTGPKRTKSAGILRQHDLVITTYQTLRSDAELLKNIQFDALVLDEAHFAKNPKALATLACRLIKARKKFALTGTPVENSLTDLFSIMNIVNPGLLSDQQMQRLRKDSSPEVLDGLGRALKPFILRRTKEAVLTELPAKQEQVLFCELSAAERTRYDELRAHYWAHLSGKVEEKGFARSKIDVLEALLRLRQAACHPGLLDDKFKASLSSKFALLIQQIESVIQDGRKALVFSQFTSLLALLKPQLQTKGISFEYLDGQTSARERQDRVDRFQADKNISLFLLSLKAGGVGLNLTAADYVFILDPWWNPAAESQAIDRAHRIGQTNQVFAYKIIAKDTVEEKILALQDSKKKLAKAVIGDGQTTLKNLSLEDLQVLFT